MSADAEGASGGEGARTSVGVVVPVYGWAPYLAEALDCVLDQDPPPQRVVVVDDGSPLPLRLVPEHAARCELVRIEHRGLAGARAAGAEVLGDDVDLVALCDADDAWEPGSLALRVRALAAWPDAALCFGCALIVGPDGRATGEAWEAVSAGMLAGQRLLALLRERNPIPVSSAVVRRGALEGAGGFESQLASAEDWDLWLRLAGRGAQFVCEPEAVVRYRRHPEAMTADVAELALAQLEVHRAHGADGEVQARDLTALADGLVRAGRYREARRALQSAAALGRLGARERALATVLRVPLLRGRLGRGDPYRS